MSQAGTDELRKLLDERHSCRGFLSRPVPRGTIEEILKIAQRTASWCNAQPWQVILLSGSHRCARFGKEVAMESTYAKKAIRRAKKLGAKQNVAVLDEGGNLKAFGRMDGGPILGIEGVSMCTGGVRRVERRVADSIVVASDQRVILDHPRSGIGKH